MSDERKPQDALAAERQRRLRARNRALLLLLTVFAALVYAVTLVKWIRQ